MNDSDLKLLAREHIDDANALLLADRFAGAIYNGGYAVECALKFRVCQTLGWTDFPPDGEHRALKSHNLNFLLNYTGKLLEIKREFATYWLRVEKWNPEMRYEAPSTFTQVDCRAFLLSVAMLVKVLIDGKL